MDLPVTAQDQQIIQQICDLAAMSTNITSRPMRAGIAAWCVNWEKRVAEAEKREADIAAARKQMQEKQQQEQKEPPR